MLRLKNFQLESGNFIVKLTPEFEPPELLSFVTLSVGYNIGKKSAVIGEFMWSGLPSNLFVLQPVRAP